MEFIKKYWYVIFIVLMMAIILFISYNTSNAGESYKKITTKEAEVLMKEKDTVIIDVRTETEYKDGHIENAINIPQENMNKDTVKIAKDKKVIVYCRTGARSRVAATILVDLGYKNVYDLGGLNNWTGQLTK